MELNAPIKSKLFTDMLRTEMSSRIRVPSEVVDKPDLRPNCPVCSVERRGHEMHRRVGN